MTRVLFVLGALGASTVSMANVPMGGLTSERMNSGPGAAQSVKSTPTVTVVEREAPAATNTALAAVAVVGGVPSGAVGSGSTETHSQPPVVPAGSVVGQTHAGVPVDSPAVASPVREPVPVLEPDRPAAPAVAVTPQPVEVDIAEVGPSEDPITEAEQAEYQRLFGEDTAPDTGAAAVEMESGVSMWIWPLALLGIAGAYVWRKRSGKGADRHDEINIVGRASLGREGSLAVIEVEDSEGRSRRLLVGYGGGAPRLVADLAENELALERSVVQAGSQGNPRSGASWDRAIQDAEDGLQASTSHEELIANVLADRDQLRRNLGELPMGGSRAGVRRRAYRGTMA